MGKMKKGDKHTPESLEKMRVSRVRNRKLTYKVYPGFSISPTTKAELKQAVLECIGPNEEPPVQPGYLARNGLRKEQRKAVEELFA